MITLLSPLCFSVLSVLSVVNLFLPSHLFAADLSGSLKNLGLLTRDTDGQPVEYDLTRLRLNAEGGSEEEGVRWQLTYDHELRLGSLLATPAYRMASKIPEPTWLDGAQTLSDGRRHQWQHRLHRGWLQLGSAETHAVLGRQRIAWGSARLWNPTDLFNPQPPLALEGEEKLGVDALLLEHSYSGFGALQAVVAPGNSVRLTPRRTAIRLRDTLADADWALVAAEVDRARILGIDLFAELFAGGIYGEAVAVRPGIGTDYRQIAVGFDTTFNPDWWESGIRLLIEGLYDGSWSRSPQPLGGGMARQLGIMAGTDLTPLWRLDGVLLLNPDRHGRALMPTLSWSARSDLTLSATAFLFAGPADSIYGRQSDSFCMQGEWFF